MEIKKKNDREVVLVPGEGININNSHDLKKEMLTLLNEGFTKITIDFSNVDTLDSSGLGKLLLFQKMLTECGGEFKIINVTSDYVKKMFNLIKLHKVIDIK